MNDNHRLIKDVSNALNFYMERTRREEGFDLSGILRPGYDLNQFKFNKLFGYSTGYDTTMKKILMPQLCLPKSFRPESDEIKLREKFYKDELKYHLKMNRKLNRSKSQNFVSRSKSNTEFISSTIKNHDKKPPRPKVPAGLLTIRSTHTPALTKREKLSMVNITSKIMSASSELCFQKEDILLMKSLADAKSQNVCYVRKSRSQSRREELLERAQQQELERSRLVKSAQDDFTSEESTASEVDKQKPITNIQPVRERSPVKEPVQTKTAEDKRNDLLNKLKALKEITEGELVKYRIVVKTGERLGSSTEATIKLKLFGCKGKSKQFKLKESKTHKIPFRRGNTDVFDLEIFDIGKIKAINVGHQEKNIEYSWFVDYIGVEDQTDNIVYTFETPDWFSITSEDKRTARILLTKNSTNLSDNESASDDDGSTSSSSSSSRSSSTSTLKSNRNKKSDRDQEPENKSFDSSSSTSESHNQSESRSRSKTESTHKEDTRGSSKDQNSAPSRPSTSISIQSQKFNDDLLSRTKTPEGMMRDAITTKLNMNIFEAVEMNRLDVLKEKLQMNPLDITKTDLSGRTLMILACEHGFESIVKYLADNSDDLVSHDTPLGYFPVHMCAQFNKLDCLRILYDVGASLQSKTNEGNTPLHLAAEHGNINIVKWLVDHNANVSIYNNSAEIAYEVAKRNGHIDIANFLSELSGMKPISTEDYSKSPFSRPDEPSPNHERSPSVRSKKSVSSVRSKKSVASKVKATTSSSSSSSSTSDSDSDMSDKKKKARSPFRVESETLKSITKASLNNSQRNRSSSSTSRSSSTSSITKTKSRTSSRNSSTKKDLSRSSSRSHISEMKKSQRIGSSSRSSLNDSKNSNSSSDSSDSDSKDLKSKKANSNFKVKIKKYQSGDNSSSSSQSSSSDTSSLTSARSTNNRKSK